MKPRYWPLAVAAALAACASAGRVPLATAPEAADWPLLLAASPDLPAPTPPAAGSAAAKADLDAVRDWQKRRTARDREAIAYWDGGAPAWRFDAEARGLLATALAPSVEAARVLAALHAAMADATVACWHAKRDVGRAPPHALDPALVPVVPGPPDPSWPDAHAAVATAAATLLGHLYPDAAAGLASKAEAIGETRVAAGVCFPTDVAAGRALGRAVAARVIARLDAAGDGRGPAPARSGGFAQVDPELPGAARWTPWLVTGVETPAPPPAPGTPAFARALAEVVAANRTLGIRERNLADKWLAAEPAGQWSARAADLVTRERLDLPHATRWLALADLAAADAAVTCWQLAYRERVPRPAERAPGLETVRFAPVHPAWPDDGAAIAGAVSTVLAAGFPAHAAALARDAEEAAEAGFDGAQHYRRDGADGLALGRAIGRAVAARAGSATAR